MILSKLSKSKPFSTLSSPRRRRSKDQSPPSLPTLLKTGFIPSLQDFNKFLIFLSQSHKFEFVLHFFSQLSSNHINGDSFTHSIVAKSLLYQRRYDAAVQFVNTQMGKSSFSKRNRLWDEIIQGFCVDEKDPEKGFLVLQDCLKIESILPSSFTFCSLIRGFCCQGEMGRAIEVMEMMADERIKYPFDNFVFSSVICGFVNIGKPELAVGFYENSVKSTDLKPNIVTYTAVLSAYCRLGRAEDVCDLVSRIEKDGLVFDVVFYGSWVYECFREGDVGEALRKHREMVERKIASDVVSYTILVDGFSKDGNVEKAVGFLHKMKKDGLKPNLFTCTAIMSGFCKKGKLEEAFAMFKMMEDLRLVPDEFAYATLIDGVCRSGDFDRVFCLLDEMDEKGIHPSIVTYNTVINGLCKARRMSEADKVSKGLLGDVITYSTLLHGYTKVEDVTGVLEIKRRLEEAQVCIDVVMCNILIKALFMVGSFENALAVFKGMPEMGLAANHVTYCTMIDEYCKVGRIDEALEIFDEFRGTSISSGACYNCIIHGLCKKDMVDMAAEVFIELNARELPLDVRIHMMLLKAIFRVNGAQGIVDLVFKMESLGCERFGDICNDAIYFLCKWGFSEAAKDLYVMMRRKGSIVTNRSYYSILDLLIHDGKMLLTQAILTNFVKQRVLVPKTFEIIICYLCMKDVKLALKFLQKKKGNMGNVTVPVTVLEKLTKNGRVVDAYTLVMGVKDNMPRMDVVDYSILIDGLCKGGHMGKALDLCALARKKGIILSIITYNSVINGLCREGCYIEAFRLFDSLEKIDVVPSEITYATLIDILSKEGYFNDAKQLLEKMILEGLKPNTRIYNSLIHGYCKMGQLQEGLKLILDLEVKGLKPDDYTVSAVIYGCCQNGDMEEALKMYFDFQKKEIFPDFLGFLYLVRGLCSKGRMEESRGVLRVMLQNPFVLDLLTKVDTGAETESMEHFLEFLCEQGSIKEAITVLDEVGFMFFPTGRRWGAHNDKGGFGKTGSDMEICSEDKLEQMVKNDGNGTPQKFDFSSYYAAIASLCSKGELQKANKLAIIFSGAACNHT